MEMTEKEKDVNILVSHRRMLICKHDVVRRKVNAILGGLQ